MFKEKKKKKRGKKGKKLKETVKIVCLFFPALQKVKARVWKLFEFWGG